MDFQIGSALSFMAFVLLIVLGAFLYTTMTEGFTGKYAELQEKESERYTMLQFGHKA